MFDQQSALRQGLLDRYAIERELGRGGMATVYLAQDLRHDRPVALKVLHPELAATLGPERFQREIRLAARLQHPHILTVLDSGETAGQLWFTMPFVEGESLRDRLRRERQLPVDAAIRIATEAARGLEYAHQHGVVHRDIKPENILLTRGGSTLVADFGIARALDADDRLTQTGFAVGTPAYMSPEQSAGDPGVDARTDVYALGCVLHEMLAGEPPYTGATAQAMIARRLSEPVPSVRSIRPSVPEAVDQAIQRALAPVAADRFADPVEFARALQTVAVTSGATPAATAAGTARQAKPRAPGRARRPLPVLAITLVAGFLLGLGVLFAWRHSRETGGAVTPEGTRVLAVLPFENLGDTSDAYFAGGLTDELRGKLAQLPGLEVIARGSSNEYRQSSKRPQEIAAELGADYLLTGTVRWEKTEGSASRVRVIPELVEIRPGQAARTRWQEPFDAALTSVFEVQAGIAGKVASALGVELAEGARGTLAASPTANLAAYDAFLKGEAAAQGLTAADPPSLRRAMNFYEDAVALDSAFAPAWAQLSRACAVLYASGARSGALGERARESAERARALGPDRPEGYLALGEYHRRIPLDPRRALEIYEEGLKFAPNHAELLTAAGVAEQDVGRWESALARLARAAALDPRSASAARRHTFALLALRRYPEAEAAASRALALAPGDLSVIQTAVMVKLAQGDLDPARGLLRRVPAEGDSTELLVYLATFEDLWWVLDDAQQRLLLTLPPSEFDDDRAAWGLVLSQLHHHRGDPRLARAYADSGIPEAERNVREAPRDGQAHVLLGLALAYAGRGREAVRAGERGAALTPLERDAYLGPYIQQLLARIYLLVGEPDRALDQLEPLLRVPHTLSPGWLRIDPTWDPLRRHPRFQRLVAGAP